MEYICFEGKRQFVSPPSYRCLAKSGGTNYITVPPPEILGGRVPPFPVIYAPGYDTYSRNVLCALHSTDYVSAQSLPG